MQQSIKWIYRIIMFLMIINIANATTWQVPTNYSTIQLAIDATEVQADDYINVISGSYSATTVSKQLTIYSNNRSVSVTSFNVTSDNVVIRDIKISGGSSFTCALSTSQCKYGIHTSATNTRLNRINIQTITGSNGISGAAIGGNGYGVYSSGSGLVIENSNISAITGGVGYTIPGTTYGSGYAGGAAYGIYATQSDEIKNNILWDLDGGNGGSPSCNRPGTATAQVGGASGDVYVFYIGSSELIYKNTVYDVSTGTIPSPCSQYSERTAAGRNAGDLYFVYAVNYANIIQNDVNDFIGKIGGASAEGGDRSGQPGGAGSDIYIVSSGNNSYIYNNTIYDLTGGNGYEGGVGDGQGGNGGAGGSIYISLSDSSQLIYNTIYDLTGGNGGPGNNGCCDSYTAAGSGGVGGHVKFTYGNNLLTNLNYYYSFSGGKGGQGGPGGNAAGNGGQGGDIWVHNLNGNVTYITNGKYINITGGLGGTTGTGGSWTGATAGAGGDAIVTKLFYTDETRTKFRNYTVQNLQYGLEGKNYWTQNTNGYATPIYPWTPSNIRPNIEDETASGGLYNITWFGATGGGKQTQNNDIEDSQSFELFVCNSTGSNCTGIINVTQIYNCTNNYMICSYNWDYTAYKGKKYLNITSNTSFSFNTTQLSNYRILLPYTLTIDDQSILPSTPYRNDTLNMTWNVTNELGRTTYANITWFKNGISWTTDNQNDITMSLSSTNTLNSSGIINSSDLSVNDNWIGKITIWDGWQSTSENTSSVNIDNYLPTTPTSITCNNGDCNVTDGFNTTINLRCSGSTDPSGDDISYYLAAFFNGSLVNGTTQGYGINVSLCSGITQAIFIPDLDYYDWTTGTLTQYNVTAENVTDCLYEGYCTGNCPQILNSSINSASSTHYLYCNNIKINSTSIKYTINSSLSTSTFKFNCSMSYVNATSGWEPNLNFTPG